MRLGRERNRQLWSIEFCFCLETSFVALSSTVLACLAPNSPATTISKHLSVQFWVLFCLLFALARSKFCSCNQSHLYQYIIESIESSSSCQNSLVPRKAFGLLDCSYMSLYLILCFIQWVTPLSPVTKYSPTHQKKWFKYRHDWWNKKKVGSQNPEVLVLSLKLTSSVVHSMSHLVVPGTWVSCINKERFWLDDVLSPLQY